MVVKISQPPYLYIYTDNDGAEFGRVAVHNAAEASAWLGKQSWHVIGLKFRRETVGRAARAEVTR